MPSYVMSELLSFKLETTTTKRKYFFQSTPYGQLILSQLELSSLEYAISFCKKIFSSWGKAVFGNASIPPLLFIICLNKSNYAYNK